MLAFLFLSPPLHPPHHRTTFALPLLLPLPPSLFFCSLHHQRSTQKQTIKQNPDFSPPFLLPLSPSLSPDPIDSEGLSRNAGRGGGGGRGERRRNPAKIRLKAKTCSTVRHQNAILPARGMTFLTQCETLFLTQISKGKEGKKIERENLLPLLSR